MLNVGLDWETFTLGGDNVESSSWNCKFVGRSCDAVMKTFLIRFSFDLVAVLTPFIKIATCCNSQKWRKCPFTDNT